MNSYVLIVIADILLAVTLAFQKNYQSKAGTTVRASLVYTILSGVFSSAMFFAINGFTVRVTWFSIVMALLFSVVLTIYVFAGFRIMEKGNVSVYTLFLMTGGMTVPYIYGVIFLDERLTVVRVLGLLFIVGAIAVSNLKKEKVDKGQLALCLTVFLLNGLASVISKAHQVSGASKNVTAQDFVFLVMVSKVLISCISLLFVNNKDKSPCKFSVPKNVIFIVFLAAVADGTSYMLQLMGAVDIPATVLYPLVTGGTIILSSLVDFAVYGQKLSCRQWIGVGIAFMGTLMFL